MSEYSSFTSEYIFDPDDYATIRTALTDLGHWLAPPIMDGDYEAPIVQGELNGWSSYGEWLFLVDSLCRIKTNGRVRFVVLWGDGEMWLIEKDPKGRIEYSNLVADPEEKRRAAELSAQRKAERKQAWWIIAHRKYRIKKGKSAGTRKRGG